MQEEEEKEAKDQVDQSREIIMIIFFVKLSIIAQERIIATLKIGFPECQFIMISVVAVDLDGIISVANAIAFLTENAITRLRELSWNAPANIHVQEDIGENKKIVK